MTTGINPVRAVESKKSGTKRYNYQEPGSFSQILRQYLAEGTVAPVTVRQDGFEQPHKEAPQPQEKKSGQSIEVQAMHRQVMKVNNELIQLLFAYKF